MGVKVDRERLTVAMARQSVCVDELAEKAGVSEKTIYSMRRGEPVRLRTLIYVCTALGVNPAEIISKRKEEDK